MAAKKKSKSVSTPEKELGLKKDFLDLAELIKSIQRREGNPDCFRRAQAHCDRLDCAWRSYCLEKPGHLHGEGGKKEENDPATDWGR